MTRLLDETTAYLDHAATSFPKPESVYVAMDAFARRIGGSGGRGSHRRAVESSNLVADTRESLSTLLGAHDPACVCFGSNATDALNTAIYGLASPGRTIVTSSVEHNSVRRPLADLRDAYGCRIHVVPADAQGLWSPADVVAALTRDTALVVLGWANNVTGALQALEPVARACVRLGIPLVVDAAQVCGAHPVQVKSLELAALAFTGHKALLGAQGTGGLIVHPEMAARIRPLRRGGSGTESHSELHPAAPPARFEAGTLNCHGLSGLNAGAQYLLQRGIADLRARELVLWRRLRDGLRELRHIRVYGPDREDNAVGIVSVTVDGMDPTDVGMLLDVRYGVLTRTGLHCAPGAHEAIGTLPHGTVRLSLGYSTTEAEIDQALHALAHVRERQGRIVERPRARRTKVGHHG